MPQPMQIALDGPVASGKTTVGQMLAQRLGYRFVDTGAMYRALTWKALREGLDLHNEAGLARLANSTLIELVWGNGQGRPFSVSVDGRDATDELRRGEIDVSVSLVARVPDVRRALVERQQAMAREGPVVMAGRDIGTVVLSQADLKVYLEASPEVRALRRHQELRQLGVPADYQQILEQLLRRDDLDSSRPNSPLRPAADARRINTDGLTLEQVVEAIVQLMGDD
ncbi:MAG: (d)CMP kinase [Chloroflexi bacterium]|nr:(d)CMP kinase [Chloroflexota bacterium]